MSLVQDLIDEIDSKITAIDSEVTMIDAETISDSVLQATVDLRKAVLQAELVVLNENKVLYQSIVDADSAELAIDTANIATGFTSGQQTVVDGIATLFGGSYDSQMSDLNKCTDQEKTDFFASYALAGTDNLKKTVIMALL